jgi:hypothetical protein
MASPMARMLRSLVRKLQSTTMWPRGPKRQRRISIVALARRLLLFTDNLGRPECLQAVGK